MNIKISELKLNQLLSIEDHLIMLMFDRVASFRHIKYEMRKRKKWFTKKDVEEIFLTNCELVVYNNYHDSMYTYDEVSIEYFIRNYNILEMRSSFVKIKKQIEKFGFKIIDNDKLKK